MSFRTILGSLIFSNLIQKILRNYFIYTHFTSNSIISTIYTYYFFLNSKIVYCYLLRYILPNMTHFVIICHSFSTIGCINHHILKNIYFTVIISELSCVDWFGLSYSPVEILSTVFCQYKSELMKYSIFELAI
jgi:hypothetical protein